METTIVIVDHCTPPPTNNWMDKNRIVASLLPQNNKKNKELKTNKLKSVELEIGNSSMSLNLSRFFYFVK